MSVVEPLNVPPPEVVVQLYDPARSSPVKTWRFTGRSSLTIGRSDERDVEISDPYVSRLHAELVWRDGKWLLLAHGRNGVLVSSRPVTEFAISPHDGAVAYVSANDLVRSDGIGGQRTVLFDGPPMPSFRAETQEAFLRAFRRLGTFDDSRPFGPWMRRVAANLCLNELARRAPPTAELDEEVDDLPADQQETPEIVRDRSEQAQRIRAGLLRLPDHYRAVIELRHYQEMSYDDMASALGIGVGDVRTRLFRARRLLARWLSDDG